MGKKKKADAAPKALSKKERKALKAREAQLAAELAAREAERKAAKKAKKGKKAKAAKPGVTPTEAEVIAAAKTEREKRRAEKKAKRAEREADAAIEAGGGSDDDAQSDAVREAVEIQSSEAVRERGKPLKGGGEMKAALEADTDAAIRARVMAKREARERDERLAQMQTDVETNGQVAKARKGAKNLAPTDSDHVLGTREKSTLEKATAAFDEAERAAAERRAVEATRDAVKAIKQAVDVVETEKGREFVAGASLADDGPEEFGNPSEAPRDDFETNGLGQYKVARPSDGKLVGYTRWTTYIDCLEDKTALEKWKARILLEGVAAAEEMGDTVTAKVRDLAHIRDVAIAKARKADRKGKLEPGQLANIVNGAWADFKKALDALADEVFEIGGGREKATKGTDIHALCDLYDREGIDAVGALLTDGEITPSDLADVEAYADAMRRLGAKVLEAERVVVNDELKVAGRLDRVVMVKLPGEARGRRRVLDIKTGRVDYAMGKIAQQIEGYAGSMGYDLDTHEREDLKLDRTKGILLHLPAGTGKATVHVVDLTLGRKGNRLAAEVRSWRNEGKRAIDLKTNVLDEIAATEEG